MSELSTSEARKLMEVYKSMCAPQQENLSEEVEKIDEQGTGSTSRPSFRAQQATAQRQVSQRLASGGDIKLRDANPLRPNKPVLNAVSGSALPNQSNRAFGTELKGRQGVVVKNAVGQGRGFAGAADTVNVAGQTLYKARKGSDILYLQGKDKPKLFNAKKPGSNTPPPDDGAGGGGGSGGGGNDKNVVSAKNIAGQQQKVTVGRQYAATLGGQAGKVTYDASGKRTFAADKPPVSLPATAKPTSSASTAPKPAAPARTFNPLMQRTFGYQTGNAPDQIAKASASAPPTPSGSALGAAAKPEVRTALNLPAKSATAPEIKKTDEIAKKTTQPPVAPAKTQIAAGYEYDAFDLVLEYLIDNGHVESVDEALYVMLEMNSEEIQDIVEARKSYSAKAARGGKDIGLPGRGFEEIATEAGKRYASKKRGKKVAGAVLAGLRAKYGK